ncbi:MAG TPA: OmpA family protein [Saprospiraceae bacterium]|nr:OmpA family protein [Saprospiraceae bacterium]HMQ83526.1 OmpA family protein [Saprospiraceae bacterium]
MKKMYWLLPLFLLTALTVHGQVQKGSFLLGTSVSPVFGRVIPFQPLEEIRFGYLLKDNLALGLEIGYQHYSFSNDNGFLHDADKLSAGLFARYFLGKGEAKLKPFVQTSIGLSHWWGTFSRQNEDYSWTSYQDSFQQFYAKMGGGLAYFLHPNVSLEVSMYKTLDFGNGYTDFGNSGINFGLNVHFGGKKERE